MYGEGAGVRGEGLGSPSVFNALRKRSLESMRPIWINETNGANVSDGHS